MTILGRRPSRIFGAPFRLANYRALYNMLCRYPDAGQMVLRYVLNKGNYPQRVRVRTPAGEIAPTLYSNHDLLTLNEIFCREDYASGKEIQTVVDIGSNIGISALYFLTRNDRAFCYLFEPNPSNIKRLKANLRGFEDRYTLKEIAVADRAGELQFVAEPTGRYGGLLAGLESRWQASDARSSVVTVRCFHVNDVLAEVLQERGAIDVLKIDIEGLESETVAAIAPAIVDRVGTIYFEDAHGTVRHVKSRADVERVVRSAA